MKDNANEYLAELIRRDNEIIYFKEKFEKTSEELEKTSEELEKTSEELEKTSEELEKTSEELEQERKEKYATKLKLLETAKLLKNLDIDIETIIQKTGLTREEIEKL